MAIRKTLERLLTDIPGHNLRGIQGRDPQNIPGHNLQGIAAAADGGDILFHEACLELGIPSEIYLAMPVPEFQKTSVAMEWQQRYRQLTTVLPVHILHPDATADAPNTIWEEANRWMLGEAAAGTRLTLIALWDGNKGETGGTAQMIHIARTHHATIEIITP